MMTGYKQTEIGAIPEDWQVRDLGSVGRVIRGSSPRPKGDKRYYGGDVPRLMVEDVTRDGKYVTPQIDYLTKEGAKRSRPCKRGTLTVVCSGTVGVPSFLAVDACIHDGFLALVQLDRSVDDEYLYYQLSSLQERFDSSATHGGVFTNLTTSGFGAFSVAFPPLPEQRAIAAALRDVDSLIHALDELVAKKRDIKQAAMQQLLTGQHRLPSFTAPWETKRLGEVIEKIEGGGTPSRSNPSYWGNEIPWMTVKDFATFDPHKTQEAITRAGLEHSAANLIPKGTLITSTRMALGKAVIYEMDVSINQDLKALFPKRNINVHYLYYWFQYLANLIESLGSGSTVMGLSVADLRNIEIRVSSLEEQAAIATFLSDMDAEIATLEARRDKTRALKQGMMQELLTGRTRLV